MGRFRVATINLHMGVPEGMQLEPRNERREAILDTAHFVVDQGVDVALLQEVRDDEPGVRRGGVAHQLRLLADAVGATQVAFDATVASGEGDRYGLCMLSRGSVRLHDLRRHDLPHHPSRERRIVQLARALLDDGATCVIGNVHLDHTGLDRPAQIASLDRHMVDAARDDPLVVGGDFNDAAQAVSDAMPDTALMNVVDGLEPGDPLLRDTHVRAGRIDHLLLSDRVRLLGQDIHEVPMRELREGDGVTDHLALVADIEIAV